MNILKFSRFISFILIFIFTWQNNAFAKTNNQNVNSYIKELTIPKGTKVKVVDFDKKKNMVKLNSVKYPGEGDSWVKMSEFVKAIDVEKAYEVREVGRLKLFSKETYGKVYSLKETLQTYHLNN